MTASQTLVPAANSFGLRDRQIFDAHMRQLHAGIDRMFVPLMFAQWAFAVGCAVWLSPFTWDGAVANIHPHVWLAVVLGGFLTLPSAVAGLWFPGERATRHLIAVCQVGFSSLLIHVTGGRIETHFHVFGSLAFLAAYRDWTVLIPATVVVAADHLVRGLFWPETVFGVATSSNWRWLEHAGWVLFEDLWLIICCLQGTREVHEIARHRAQLEQSHAELSRAKDAAEAASLAKSQFLANMSHEIRTPLNAILGFTEILRTEDPRVSKEERDGHLNAVHRSGSHLLSVINDILDLSKIEAGQMQYERLRVSPHQVAVEVLSLLRVRAVEKGINLDLRWVGRVPETIVSDPARVRQLLLNLVGNAIKFTERGGVQIIARLLPAEELLQFEVIDTGIGIPADKLETIFAPFSQADLSVTRKFGGTGLGLSISRHIAGGLGGRIQAQSCEGQGSTVTVTVATGSLDGVQMLDAPPAEALTAPTQGRPSTRLNGMRVLVVDDGDSNRKLLEIFLTRAGAVVETAENGRVAVDKIVARPFDAVLMDMQMPVLDGYSATRELRAKGCTLPIIALTAHAMSGEEAKCRAAGCDGYLTKPVESAMLISALSRTQSTPVAAPVVEPNQVPADHQSSETLCACELDLDDLELRSIVAEFIVGLSGTLQKLESAWQERNWELLSQISHSLKGTAGMTGFRNLSQAAGDLETAARARSEQTIAENLPALVNLGERVIRSFPYAPEPTLQSSAG